jgi:hypothetical protein
MPPRIFLKFECSPAEKAEICGRARTRNLTASEFLRRLALDEPMPRRHPDLVRCCGIICIQLGLIWREVRKQAVPVDQQIALVREMRGLLEDVKSLCRH